MLISVNYAECSNMDFKEYNGEHKHSWPKKEKRERKKENIYYCLFERNMISTLNFINHFARKLSENACIHFVIKSAIILQALKEKFHRESHEGVEEPPTTSTTASKPLVCGVPITLSNQKAI